MRRSIVRFAVVISMLSVTLHSSSIAQTFTPFKASEGTATAVSSAKSGGFTKGMLTSIVSLGDTTFFGSYLPANLKSAVNIDMSKGTSAFWGYRFAQNINNVDSSASYAVVKPLFFLAVPASIPDLPDVPIRIDTALPSAFLDSDGMLQKVTANAAYASYIQRFPKTKVQSAALGMSLPDRPVQMPLWVVFIARSLDEPTLTCIIEAADNNGSCTCVENSVSSVKESRSSTSAVLFPNPLCTSSLSIAFGSDAHEGNIRVRVYTSLGTEVFSTETHRVPGGTLDVAMDGATSGAYSVCIDDGTTREWLRMIKQ